MRTAVVVTAIVSAVTTAALALLPQLHLAYSWQAENLALEMAASVIALLACFLVFGRLRRRTRLNELMLACALAVFALSNLLLVTVPMIAGWAPDDLTVWAAPAARSLGAVLFGLAAFVPSRRLRRSGLVLAAGAIGVIATLLLTTVLVREFARRSPSQVINSLTPASSARPDLHPHLAQLALQLTVAGLYGMATVGFLRRSRRLGDEFFGVACRRRRAGRGIAYQLPAVSGHKFTVSVCGRPFPFCFLHRSPHWLHAGDLVVLVCAV